MKTLRLLGAALVLALSLSFSVYADTDPGDIHTPGRADGCATQTQCTIAIEPTGDSSTDDNDSGFPTIYDILWDLASIY
jgi:hypothetical protein